jgi:hypothetical protein
LKLKILKVEVVHKIHGSFTRVLGFISRKRQKGKKAASFFHAHWQTQFSRRKSKNPGSFSLKTRRLGKLCSSSESFHRAGMTENPPAFYRREKRPPSAKSLTGLGIV